MNFSVLFKPLKLIQRVALQISRNRRLGRLKNTVGENLKLGHIDSLELLEIISNDDWIRNAPLIFDIGSNVGTWTLLAKAVMPGATIYAFEPLKEHNEIFKQACAHLSNIYLNEYCVGNANTTASINISSYSDSSSLLPATRLEYEHFNIKKQREESVSVKRLLDLIDDQALPVPDIIKLDVQGFELEALKGMGRHLLAVKYVICEVSFKEYYQGQPLFLDIANYLAQHNLQILAFGHNTPCGAELNQIDVLFKSIQPVA
jgi:FkbM family methyltransferase